MEIFVRSYKRIATADLSFHGICLIGGKNEAGKSSLAEAIRAAITGEGIALEALGERLTKAHHAPALVRWGADKGNAVVRIETGAVSMTWPKCDYASEGAKPPRASRIAAGLDSLARMRPEERAKFLVELLKAMPTKGELLAELVEQKIGRPDDVANYVWDVISRDGWDAPLKKGTDGKETGGALSLAKAKGATRKGQFREVTGENWGSDKGADWAPQGWNPKWDALSIDQADAGISVIRNEVEAFDKAAGANEATIAGWRAAAASLPELEAAVLPSPDDLGKAVITAEVVRAALPTATDGEDIGQPCPHCQGMLVPVPGKSPPWRAASTKKLTAAELKKVRLAIADADGTVANARDAYQGCNAKLRQHEAALQAARAAVEKLKDVPETGADRAEERQKLAERLTKATEVGQMIRKRIRACEIDGQIRENQRLVAILEPDGLRQRKLGQSLATFNDLLGDLSAAMGCRRTGITDEMGIDVGSPHEGAEVAYWQMSASQQFRTRILLQVAVAMFDGSDLVVIDNDVDQDRAWLRGTLKMLGKIGIAAVITLRADGPDEVPPAPPAASGMSIAPYWIGEDGVVRPIAEALAEAAE